MSSITEYERNLYELTRKHIREEKNFKALMSSESNIEPINLKATKELISKNIELEEDIRKLLGESESWLKIDDLTVRKRLIEIRDMKTWSREYYDDIELSELSAKFGLNKNQLLQILSDTELLKKFVEIISVNQTSTINAESDEKDQIKIDQEFDEMIDYFAEMAGYSGDFHERKKKLGTIIVNKSLPPDIDVFWGIIKDNFLLHKFEAVIGISRILLEVSCQHIFDRIPYKDKLRRIDGEFGAKQKIREACKFKLNKKTQ